MGQSVQREGLFVISLSVLTKYARVCAGGCEWVLIKVYTILMGLQCRQ